MTEKLKLSNRRAPKLDKISLFSLILTHLYYFYISIPSGGLNFVKKKG